MKSGSISRIKGDSRPVMSPSQRALSKQMMKYWGPWETNMKKSTNSRMLQELVFDTEQTIKTTSTKDLDVLPLSNNDHSSVLSFEMYTLESGETPSRTLTWNPLGFLRYIQCRTNDDRFPSSLWEVWFRSTLGTPIPTLIGPSQWCACNAFITTLSKITCRHVELSPRLHRHMIGWYTVCVAFSVRWVTELLLAP